MRRSPWTLLGLIGLVALAAAGLATVRSHWESWPEVVAAVVISVLLLGCVLARYGPRRSRPFWFGFALFGIVAHVECDPAVFGRLGLSPNRRAPALIQRAVVGLLGRLGVKPRPLDRIGLPVDDPHSSSFVNFDQVVRLGVVAMTLAIATVGGAVATLVRRSARRLRDRPPRGDTAGRLATIVVLLAALAVPAVARSFRPRPEYFPAPGRPEVAGFDPIDARGYADALAAMGEPPLPDLACRDPTAEVYRLLFLPVRYHGSATRVTRTNSGATVQTEILDGTLTDLGTVGVDRTRSATPREWSELEAALASIRFWADPPAPPPRAPDVVGVGDPRSRRPDLVIEGVRAGRYRVITLDFFEDPPLVYAFINLSLQQISQADYFGRDFTYGFR